MSSKRSFVKLLVAVKNQQRVTRKPSQVVKVTEKVTKKDMDEFRWYEQFADKLARK